MHRNYPAPMTTIRGLPWLAFGDMICFLEISNRRTSGFIYHFKINEAAAKGTVYGLGSIRCPSFILLEHENASGRSLLDFTCSCSTTASPGCQLPVFIMLHGALDDFFLLHTISDKRDTSTKTRTLYALYVFRCPQLGRSAPRGLCCHGSSIQN